METPIAPTKKPEMNLANKILPSVFETPNRNCPIPYPTEPINKRSLAEKKSLIFPQNGENKNKVKDIAANASPNI